MRRQRQPQVVGFAVGLDFPAGKIFDGHLLALRRVDALQPRELRDRTILHQPLPGGERKSRGGPPARAHRSQDAFAQTRRRDQEAERYPRRDLLGEAVERDASVRRQRSQRRLVVEKAVDDVLDDGEVKLFDDAHEIGATCRRHGHAQRILNDRLHIDGRQMRFAVRLLHGIRPHALLVHRQRDQRHAEPGSDALDEGVGQSLDTATPAGWHHRSEGSRDTLPAIPREGDVLRGWQPVLPREICRRNASGSWAYRCC